MISMTSSVCPEKITDRSNELPVLKFHNKFLGPIVSGDKVSTIRRKPLDFKLDGVVLATFTGTTLTLKLVIIDLGTKRFKDLDKHDAWLEGYSNLDDLRDELLNIYPKIKPSDRVYYYRFATVGGNMH